MRIAPSLAALALIGATVPAAHALSIKDDTVSVGVKVQLQTRGQFLNDADNAAGEAYDPLRDQNGDAEAARFYIRRARMGLAAKYGDWRGNFQIRAGEGADRAGLDSTRGVQLYYANGAYVFKTGEIEHDVHFGLDKPFNSESSISSSAQLFPTDRLIAQTIEVRNVGLGYGLRSAFVNFGVDVMNNSTTTKDAQAGNGTGAEETNGYFFSGRIEIMPGKEFNPGKRQESYVGKEGTHLVLGLDLQQDNGNLSGTPAATFEYRIQDTFTWGPDLLVHWNNITFLAEYRMRSTDLEDVDDPTSNTSASDFDGRFWNVQLGYAFPLESGTVIEPAIRFAERDDNTDVDESSVYGASNDNGASGTTLDVGLNVYFAGHGNKVQLAYQSWEAEEGDGTASIVRLQHQLNF